MENRIRELRKTRGMNQEALANYIGVSQQTISKIERNTNSLSMDILICLADYLLGLSNEKRNKWMQNRVRSRLEEYNDFIAEYEELNEYNQKAVMEIIKALKEIQRKEL